MALRQDLETLHQRGYVVVPVYWIAEWVAGLRDGSTLPNKVVGITFDDGANLDWIDGNGPYDICKWSFRSVLQEFKSRHPGVRVRLTGLNSSAVADAVRDGHLEAGLIILPVDDRGLDVRPLIRDEIVFLSRDPRRAAQPMTIERLLEAPLILYDARYGSADPARRQLLERAQSAGLAVEPDIEVESLETALELAARGLGDTIAPTAVGSGRAFARRLHVAAFDPPLHDVFAVVQRRGARPSPATRAFIALAEKRIVRVVERLREGRTAAASS